MQLGDILRMIGRRSYVWLAAGLIGLAVTIPTQYRITAHGLAPATSGYRASVRMVVDEPRAKPTAALTAPIKLVFVGFLYGQVAQDYDTAARVSERVHGAYSPGELMRRVRAFPVAPATMLNVDAVGDTPPDAVAIAGAYAAAMQDWLEARQARLGIPDDGRLELSVVDAPTEAGVTSLSLVPIRWLLFGFLAGCAVGLAWVLTMPSPSPRARRSLRRMRRPKAGAAMGRRRSVSVPATLPSVPDLQPSGATHS